MEALLAEINWLPTLVAFVLSFALGWVWYSPLMFVKGWQEGIGEPVWRVPMWMPMSAQVGSTLLYAIVIGLAVSGGHLIHAILVGLTIAGFVKANGFYSGKTMYAVSVEVGYIVAMTILMIVVHTLM